MYCYKCGKEIPDEAIFCPKCGASQQANEVSRGESDETSTKSANNNLIKLITFAASALCIGIICGLIFAGIRRRPDKSVNDDDLMITQQLNSESPSDEADDNQTVSTDETYENVTQNEQNKEQYKESINNAEVQEPTKGFEDLTEEEWKTLALKYFMEVESAPASAYVPSEVDVYFDDPEPGKVSIHLYDDMGTHDATANWYCVDIISGLGTDTSNNPIDFNKVIYK
ncbi:MAG: zinc ribbon domain-containing protein [Lachnospiraceae bacterium]|nr:zinc ribbon domain-containing protein [Lachnospiraceae bacterium]